MRSLHPGAAHFQEPLGHELPQLTAKLPNHLRNLLGHGCRLGPRTVKKTVPRKVGSEPGEMIQFVRFGTGGLTRDTSRWPASACLYVSVEGQPRQPRQQPIHHGDGGCRSAPSHGSPCGAPACGAGSQAACLLGERMRAGAEARAPPCSFGAARVTRSQTIRADWAAKILRALRGAVEWRSNAK